MPAPHPQDWISRALTSDPVMDVGQLDAETRRALNSLAETGRLVKGRVLFHGLVEKTCWSRPELIDAPAPSRNPWPGNGVRI